MRVVSLLWQMRPLVPAICGHMRQKDDKLWQKWILHDAGTEERYLWVLCQREVHKCEMHGLSQTGPLGWILNSTAWENACNSDLNCMLPPLQARGCA